MLNEIRCIAESHRKFVTETVTENCISEVLKPLVNNVVLNSV